MNYRTIQNTEAIAPSGKETVASAIAPKLTGYRLPPIPGEWIDRRYHLSFAFEGTNYTGYAGDSVTSALWAGGQRILGRSFKYHRPRGILSLANHDINALMQAGQRLNLRADVTPLEAGMNLSAVNTFGGVMGDRASVLNFLSPFLPVGFYYKTFLGKDQFPFWERLIRTISGLGKVDLTTPHHCTPKRYDFCDVLVIGAGVAGLSAALTAADAGADVVLVDENAQAGGAGGYQLGGDSARREQTVALVQSALAHANIRFYSSTVAAGYFADHWVPLVNPTGMTKMRAKSVIVASGVFEQLAVFRNNDLPGVMLASAAQRLIYRYAVKPMHRAVVLTANNDGYRAALDLATNGVIVQAIVDLRPEMPEAPLNKESWGDRQQARSLNIPIFPAHCIYEAKPNPAGDGVASAVICPFVDGKPQPERKRAIACDGIVMSVGWAPAANLLYQAGTQMQFDDRLQQFLPDQLPAGVFACGRVNGVYDFDQKIQDGQRTGLSAAKAKQSDTELGINPDLRKAKQSDTDLGINQSLLPTASPLPFPTSHSPTLPPSYSPSLPVSHPPTPPLPLTPHPKGKEFLDFDEDLQLKDFPNAVQEGFDNIELLKRFTTIGMGPSQGKHSNMNALRLLAQLTGKTPGEVGTTTARPFFHPVSLSHLAGRGFTPERQTPLHSRHAALGAQFMLAGVWQRPEFYAQPNKSRTECIQQEVEAVRSRVGIIDVGTLGKLEIRGADAAAFLERVYTGRFANLKVGMTRYAVMVDEAGVVIDDGVVARLGTEHFYFTTTTSGAAAIYRELSRLNTLWQMDCGIVNLTGARSAVNLAGPDSRKVLATLTDCDLSAATFPYLGVRETAIAGIPALLMRVGFVGEWGYEIHVAAETAPALWDALMAAGADYSIRPFGVEAQRLLRLEKGHLIVGQDTDGLTTPLEANLDWAVKLDKPFFIGQRSLQQLRQRSPEHKLVGFQLEANFRGTPPQECHLVIEQGDIAGRVTSIAFSPTLQRYIGLAYLKSDRTAIGTPFSIRVSDGSLVTALVSQTPFYDPDNKRQKDGC